jgi:hypothetical protein
MSNPLAIAAVTATLRHLLDEGINAHIPGTTVSTKPLDKAFNGSNCVNLFLYQANINPALRNMDLPHEIKSGESGSPALALDLYYLVTAYGESEEETDPTTHKLMGYAMSILHDHTLLGRTEIRDALADNDLHEQFERVRITHQPMGVDELSKLWTTFQTNYRLSTAYQAAVVLIDSNKTKTAPLPVLRRGPQDQGVNTLLGPFPTIEKIVLPTPFVNARLGDELEIHGHHLGGMSISVRFSHADLSAPIILSPLDSSTDKKLLVTLPNDVAAQSQWAAGIYNVSVVIQKSVGSTDRVSNNLPLQLAPSVNNITPNPATPDGGGTVTLQLMCSPQVLAIQRVMLLIGDRSVPAEAHSVQTDTLSFVINEAMAGQYVVRLRIDGVDSIPVVQTPSGMLEFDPNQKVTIS